MNKKVWSIIIIILNIVGIVCLVYYAIPYLTQDVTVPNPVAMLPMQNWEAGGMALTIGLVPLAVVNVLAMVFVGKEKIKMPLRVLFLIPCILCLGIVAHYWISGLGNAGEGKGTSSSIPIVNVKLELKDSSEVQYGTIYEDGSVEVINEAVAVEDAEVYVADVNNFSAKTENGKVVNTLISNVVTDSEGNEFKADGELSNLLQIIAETVEHDILEAKIFKDGQMYYIAVQTNVNWQSPCDFYQYEPSAGKILYLNSWDNMNVLGVASAK